MSEKCFECEFIPTGYDSIVCQNCGIEKTCLPGCTQNNVGYASTHSPFQFGYSRVKRFSQMVTNLLFPAASNQDNRMVQYLYTRRHCIKTRKNLNFYIYTSKLRDKRFSSMHFFCKVFLPLYRPPKNYGDLYEMRKRMSFYFERICLQFTRRFPQKPFINYCYLMRRILCECGFYDYLPYVKKLKCKKRKNIYSELLCQLGFPTSIHL